MKKIRWESKLHQKLKEIAAEWINSKGERYSVSYEVPVKIDDRYFIVDLVAVAKGGEKIAIECGSVNYSKMKALSKIFDKVINFRAVDALEFLEEKVEQLENELEKERKLNGIIKARMIQKAMVMEFPKLRLPLR